MRGPASCGARGLPAASAKRSTIVPSGNTSTPTCERLDQPNSFVRLGPAPGHAQQATPAQTPTRDAYPLHASESTREQCAEVEERPASEAMDSNLSFGRIRTMTHGTRKNSFPPECFLYKGHTKAATEDQISHAACSPPLHGSGLRGGRQRLRPHRAPGPPLPGSPWSGRLVLPARAAQ